VHGAEGSSQPMTTSDLLRYALCVGAAAYLGGCGSVPPAPSGPGGASRMAARANTKDLLYVTNGTTVDVFSYPQGEVEGQLTGFSSAAGSCIDGEGDVYIADYDENTIVEYAHGGTQPLRTLPVPGDGPSSCAVDPRSGNLAGSPFIVRQKEGQKATPMPPSPATRTVPTIRPAISLSTEPLRGVTATTSSLPSCRAKPRRLRPLASRAESVGRAACSGTGGILPSVNRSTRKSSAIR